MINTIKKITTGIAVVGLATILGYTANNLISYSQARARQEARQPTQTGIPIPNSRQRGKTLEEVASTSEPQTQQETTRQEESQIIQKYPNPKYTSDDNFAGDSETMLFARAIYGEARKQIVTAPAYVVGVAESIATRAQKKGKSVKETVLNTRKNDKGVDVYAYTCFNPKDVNYKKIRDPLGNKEAPEEVLKKAWGRCYEIADQALKTKCPIQELEGVTNYYVGKKAEEGDSKKDAQRKQIPSWAYEMENGKFILDKQGKRIPRKPTAVIPIPGIGDAFFYRFENF